MESWTLRWVLPYVVGEWILPDILSAPSLPPSPMPSINACRPQGPSPGLSKARTLQSSPCVTLRGTMSGKEWMWVFSIRVTESKWGRGLKKKSDVNNVQVRHQRKCSRSAERMFPLLTPERGIWKRGGRGRNLIFTHTRGREHKDTPWGG